MRSALGFSTLRRCRRSGWPATISTSTVSPGSVPGTKIGPLGSSATPSPRWPIRPMTRCSSTWCSTTFGLDEEFAIAVAAAERGRSDAADAPAERRRECADVLTYRLVHVFVAHDAFLQMAARRLKLRLDERQKLGAGCEKLSNRRQHQLERDETHVDCCEIRRPGHK